MNFLNIFKMKGQCSIQDLGRLHSQHLGFSASGAADEYAFLSANQMLGNERNNAALEIIFGELSVVSHNNCTIAITGANCFATINGKKVEHWQTHQLNTGDVLSLSTPKYGLISYLAIANGIKSKPWLDSRSQTLNEQKLGFNGETIRVGSKLYFNDQPSQPPNINHSKQLSPENFYQAAPLTLRFIPQLLWQQLSTEQQTVFQQHYTISANSNRMGYRLSQSPQSILVHLPPGSRLSKPVPYGTIQIPENGEPIILMKERQTIGGYPVLGTVIQTDLFRLSQRRPGEKVQLRVTTLVHAQQQLNAFHQRFKP